LCDEWYDEYLLPDQMESTSLDEERQVEGQDPPPQLYLENLTADIKKAETEYFPLSPCHWSSDCDLNDDI